MFIHNVYESNYMFCFVEVIPKGIENIFLAATVGSFYKQVMPKKSVDFGLCITAVHWLSERY